MDCIVAVVILFGLALLVLGMTRGVRSQLSSGRMNGKRNEFPGAVYVHREGKLQPADEGFKAWMSGDLQRMERALSRKVTGIDRHFLYLQICKDAYRNRRAAKAREKFLRYAREHVAAFPELLPALKREFGDELPRVPTFQQLATVLMEDGDFDEAVDACHLAISYGLADGTKTGFEGRIARIERRRERYAN